MLGIRHLFSVDSEMGSLPLYNGLWNMMYALGPTRSMGVVIHIYLPTVKWFEKQIPYSSAFKLEALS